MRLAPSVVTLAAGVGLALSVTGCAARRVPSSFPDMERRVAPGATVALTTADGHAVHGRLTAVSGRSIRVALKGGSARDFEQGSVREIRVADSLWNGLLIGGAAGGAAFGLLSDESCGAPAAAPDCRHMSRAGGAAIGAAIGAALGAGFDALHRRLVFRSAAGPPSVLIVEPVVAPGTTAIRAAWRF